MYCPKCGKENSHEQRFCRSCGLNLQTISQAMTHELSESQSVDDMAETLNRGLRGWHNPVIYGFLIIIIGLIMGIFGKEILGEKLISDIGILMALLGVGLLGFKGVLLTVSQSQNLPRPKVRLEGESPNKRPYTLQSGEPPSVTEHTTRTFEPIRSERKAK